MDKKKSGWYVSLRNPEIAKTSTSLDQLHNTLDRKLFMMKGFHHPKGNQKKYLNGLAIIRNCIPYQRRAKNAGKCPLEVAGAKLPAKDWLLNIQILTSGGFS